MEDSSLPFRLPPQPGKVSCVFSCIVRGAGALCVLSLNQVDSTAIERYALHELQTQQEQPRTLPSRIHQPVPLEFGLNVALSLPGPIAPLHDPNSMMSCNLQ